MFTRAGFPLLFLLLVSSNRLGVMGNDQDLQKVHEWTEGKSSKCSALANFCDIVSGGERMCLDRCLANAQCNTVNFCPQGADCTGGVNMCCLKKCQGNDYQLTTEFKGWNIWATKDCPVGYEEKNGDVPGWGTDLGSALELTRGECARKCSEKDTCLSFEHSNTEMKCNLNKIAEPSSGPYKDYVFCKKQETCNDKLSDCEKSNANCTVPYIQENCKKYCHLCGPPCNDEKPNCDKEKVDCNIPYNQKSCKKYCRLCEVNGDCSCMDYVNADGFGNCLKQAGHLRGPHCYVNQPSTCKDIKTSTTEEGKQYSVEACEKNQE